MIGQTISHYKILEKLGGGGMGIVYKAEDIKLKRTVALKFLPPELTRDDEAKQRFVHGAQAASALDHPNICTVHEIDETDEHQIFISMACYDGETLKSRIAKGGLRTEEAVDIVIQVAHGLQKAHDKGIVHRDIKPANIIITSDGIVKILDFGLAKLVGQTQLTKTGSTLGTVAYMSPEQARGEEVDARTDIWSLGVVLYEMLAAKLPFRGEHDAAVIYSIMNEDPAPLSKSNVNASDELQTIVSRTLAKEKEERYQTVSDLLADLHPELDRLKGKTQTPASGRMSVVPKASRLKKTLRNPLAIGIILVCVVAMVWVAVSTFLIDNSLKYESLEIQKLTNSGDILVAALSPDGQYVAYSTRVSKGCNLYLRHIPSASTTKLWQADEGSFGSFPGLTFAPGGNYLYFIYESNLCRLARLGGEPKIIVRGRLSYFAISPDGKRLAINRFRKLVTMNEDGSDERKSGLDTTEKYIYRVISNGRAWSPDGRFIALKCFSGDFVRTGLMIHNLIDSTEIDILNPLWSRIDNVFWAADAKSLLLTGERTKGETSQIWNVSYPQGEVRQITSDANGFSDLSASADGKSLLAIQSTYANSLWVLPSGDEFKIQKVPTGEQTVQGWTSWTADNRILFVTGNSREHSLKAVYPDGSKLMTLYSDTIGFASASQVVTTFTSGGAKSRTFLFPPQIVRDTRTFYFESFGSGRSNIWRVDLQSGSRQSIYQGTSLASMAMSADEEWLYITNQSGLLKVRNDGKQVDTIFAEVGEDVSELRLSPDGIRISSSRYNKKLEQYETVIVDVKSRKLVQTLPITSSVEWTPDGRGLSYIITANNVPNIWTQSLAGGKPKQITHFPSDEIVHFNWSPDGKYLDVVRRSNPSDVYLLTVKK